MSRARRPNNWVRIERAIKLRADFRCECGMGWDCNSSKHHGRCPNIEGQRYIHNKRRIALRVAQVGPPNDWQPQHLVALCLPCYLRWEDQRKPKLIDTEQESLFDV